MYKKDVFRALHLQSCQVEEEEASRDFNAFKTNSLHKVDTPVVEHTAFPVFIFDSKLKNMEKKTGGKKVIWETFRLFALLQSQSWWAQKDETCETSLVSDKFIDNAERKKLQKI